MEVTNGASTMSRREKLCAQSPRVQGAQDLHRFLLPNLPGATQKMAALMDDISLYESIPLKIRANCCNIFLKCGIILLRNRSII